MLTHFRDRNGQPILLCHWMRLFEDEHYKVIGYDEVGEGEGKATVSTVWTGLPLVCAGEDTFGIFETLVRGRDVEETMHKYSTEAEAWQGHEAIVKQLRTAHEPIPSEPMNLVDERRDGGLMY